MTPLDGAAVEPMAYAFRAVRYSGVVEGDNVVILGLEDYGLGAARITSAYAGSVVATDPSAVRRAAAERAGIGRVLDATTNLSQEIRTLLPFGADVVFLNAEEYVPRSQDYLKEAYEVARTGAMIKMVRMSGPELMSRADAQLGAEKELRLSYNGGAFGMEAWRGGRNRGDWQATMEAMGKGALAIDTSYGLEVSFDELRSQRDVDDMLAAVPTEAAKVFVKVEA
jgi:threonine dehydrogenase-like Zn-dependent dehydrogenase